MALAVALVATTLGQSPSPGVDLLGSVFKAGDANMSCYRIPSVVQTSTGTVSRQPPHNPPLPPPEPRATPAPFVRVTGGSHTSAPHMTYMTRCMPPSLTHGQVGIKSEFRVFSFGSRNNAVGALFRWPVVCIAALACKAVF